jgi:hypothetical protein
MPRRLNRHHIDQQSRSLVISLIALASCCCPPMRSQSAAKVQLRLLVFQVALSTVHEQHRSYRARAARILCDSARTDYGNDYFSKSSRRIDVRHADTTGTYVEATGKRVLPFSIEDAGIALWENYPDLRPANQDVTQEAEFSQNVIVRETELRLRSAIRRGRPVGHCGNATQWWPHAPHGLGLCTCDISGCNCKRHG